VATFPPPGMTLELLNREHRRKRFESGDPRVDAWLIHKAIGAMEKSTSTTRVLVQSDGTVAGYYTLATTALDVSLVPPAFYERMGFLPVPGTTNKLYMPAATLMQVTNRG
jgi:hypothetical protein